MYISKHDIYQKVLKTDTCTMMVIVYAQ